MHPSDLRLIMLVLLAKTVASGELTCNTTPTSNGTVYKVPDFGKPKCDAQWSDADNDTLADSEGKNGSLVFASNSTTLHTYHCYNIVMYVLDCYPEPKIELRCLANCSESAGVSVASGTSKHVVIAAIVLVLVLVLCVFGVISYRRCQRRNQRGL